ncbi:hypothetical protein E4634_02415 [Mangrovimicrobium sediminis]|uniref:Uncharacterized protein n=1 Tax=Mangrovimicrobium sediminis TaxID=2562682 RepID=A0A4Z0M8L8_9GAMM|nr:hypothetical protein E4634_02415 [Haliea sp. SAOS-164]
MRLRLALLLVLLPATALTGGCVSSTVKTTAVPAIDAPSRQVPDDLLLDVGIATFDPGIDDLDDDEVLLVYPEVRNAEARFMPGQLAEAMQQSGAWGAVRVVPDPERIADLLVQGEILHSDGEHLELAITARDARGQTWLERTYEGHASAYAYKETAASHYDPFQAVYNDIANDLLAVQEKLGDRERRNIRLTSELRFAQHFSPDAFAGYLEKNRDGNYVVTRLPAEGDPMLARIGRIRDRDNLYVDTMQEYYDQFDNQIYPPYQEWRKESYAEAIELQELQAKSRAEMIAGATAVLAGIFAHYDAANDDPEDEEERDRREAQRAAGSVAILGGGALLKSGLEKRSESKLRIEALSELGQSLEAEITPQVIDLEDRSVTLTGTVEDQYAQWQELLADIYETEIGALEPAPGAMADSTDTL